jgi:hypothetical protein
MTARRVGDLTLSIVTQQRTKVSRTSIERSMSDVAGSSYARSVKVKRYPVISDDNYSHNARHTETGKAHDQP